MRVQYYTTIKNIKIIRKKKEIKTEIINKDINKNVEDEGKKDINNIQNVIVENNEVENKEEQGKENIDELNKIIEKKEEKGEKEELIFENDEENSDEELFEKDINRLGGDFIYDVNQIKMTEDKFMRKLLEGKNKRLPKLIVINKSLKNKIKVKLGLVRYVLYSYERDKNFLKLEIRDNYQTDKILDFIRNKSLTFSVRMKERRSFQEDDKEIWKWENE